MRSNLLKSAAIVVTAAGMALVASAAAQAAVLPVQNLTFSIYSGANPKDAFTTVNPANWTRGPLPPPPGSDLVYIDAPGTATQAKACPTVPVFGVCYSVYGDPITNLFPDPPPGGNFVQADGNPDFESIFQQVIPGLVAGEHYTLTFWQAAGQENFPFPFSGDTIEQWRVVLGGTGITLTPPAGATNCTAATISDGFTNCYGFNANGGYEDIANEFIMHTPSQGLSGWNLVSLDLIAPQDGDNLLQFLAWGDGGSNANLPPTLFLAGVNTPGRAPEPATLSLFGAGLAGVWLRRRAKRKA